MAKARQKTEYELKVDVHIPAAVAVADKAALQKYPELAPRIINGPKHSEPVKLSQISRQDREPYFEVIDYWNREYHAAMDSLCQKAGLR